MSEDKEQPPSTKANGSGAGSAVEATEADPCIEDSKILPKKRWQKYRDDVCDKTDLTKRNLYIGIAILVACFLLFVVVVALSAAWPRLAHSKRFPVCQEYSCLKASSQIRESMNSAASPCVDLWNFTCGGWLSKYPLPKDRSRWNQKEQLMRKEYERVRNQIASLKLPIPFQSVKWKLKHFYESCLDLDNIKSDGSKPLTNIISELGYSQKSKRTDTM